MTNPLQEINQLDQQFLNAYKYFKNKQYKSSINHFQLLADLMHKIINEGVEYADEKQLKKKLGQCYLNIAVCKVGQGQEEGQKKEGEVMEFLENALKWDNLSYWTYFNMFSQCYQQFDYLAALNNLKCCLSCLYLNRAVLSKDLQNTTRQKDLGKSLSLCSNNIQALLLRLTIHINSSRWKKAINQISLIQQLIGQSKHLYAISEILKPYSLTLSANKVQDPTTVQYLVQQCIKLILKIKQESDIVRLVSAQEVESDEENIIKKINQKLNQFNQLQAQVNQLGRVFGLFNFSPVCSHNFTIKKLIMIGNIIDPTHRLQDKDENYPKQKTQQIQKLSIDFSAKIFSGLKSINNQSLFDYTKSHNDANQMSKTQLSGKLLSSVQPSQQMSKQVKPLLLTVEEENYPQMTSSGFNNEGLGTHKDMEIRVIESQIHPVQDEVEAQIDDGPFVYTPNSLHNSHKHLNPFEDDEDLLLDSAFNKSFASKTSALKSSKASPRDLVNESKRSKLSQKKSRIYPLKEPYKYIQLFLAQIQFKQSRQKLVQVYCEIEVKGNLGKMSKFVSRRENSKSGGMKARIQWNQSLGFVGLPQEPQNVEVKVMRSERDKFFDTCLGKGEIQMTSAGLNKFPVYNGTKLVAMVSLTLILAEECLNSSYKQSNLSSSYQTESLNSLS